MPRITGPEDAASVFTIKTSHYLIAGFSLVVALSWNKSIENSIHSTFPLQADSLKASVLYSVIITMVLILVIWFLPDTKSELPLDTQHRLHRAEIAEHRALINANRAEIIALRQNLNIKIGE